MSFQAMTWAVSKALPAMSKIVLLMLANRTNADTGRCDPSYDRLASDCGMSVRAVKDQIRSLEEKGFLTIIRRSEGNVSLSNHYLLNLSNLGGVVQEVHHPRSAGRALPVQDAPDGSAGGAQGVVQEVHPKQEVKPLIETTPKTPRGADADFNDGFEEFEGAFPFTPVMSREQARRRWKTLSIEEQKSAIVGVPIYVDACRAMNRKICDGSTYLALKRWDDAIKSPPALEPMVFVQKGTPAFEAWQQLERDRRGDPHHKLFASYSANHGVFGTFRKRLFPPGIQPPSPQRESATAESG